MKYYVNIKKQARKKGLCELICMSDFQHILSEKEKCKRVYSICYF